MEAIKLKVAIDLYVEIFREAVEAHWWLDYPMPPMPEIKTSLTRGWVKVYVQTKNAKMAHCFIDMRGNIYKPKSYDEAGLLWGSVFDNNLKERVRYL